MSKLKEARALLEHGVGAGDYFVSRVACYCSVGALNQAYRPSFAGGRGYRTPRRGDEDRAEYEADLRRLADGVVRHGGASKALEGGTFMNDQITVTRWNDRLFNGGDDDYFVQMKRDTAAEAEVRRVWDLTIADLDAE